MFGARLSHGDIIVVDYWNMPPWHQRWSWPERARDADFAYKCCDHDVFRVRDEKEPHSTDPVEFCHNQANLEYLDFRRTTVIE